MSSATKAPGAEELPHTYCEIWCGRRICEDRGCDGKFPDGAPNTTAPTPTDRVGEDVGRYRYSGPTDWWDWQCPDCGSLTHARVDEWRPNRTFGPGPLIRCVNCKSVFDTRKPAPAPSDPAEAGGDLGELVKRARQQALVDRTLYGDGGISLYDDLADAIVDLLSTRSGQLVASTPGQKGAGEEKTSATPLGSGSRPSDQAASHPAPAGFDPSRGPAYQGEGMSGERFRLGQILMEAFCEHGAGYDVGRGVFELGVDRVLMAREALAGEARSAETQSGSVEDEHAAPQGATPAQTPPSPPSATPEGDPPMTVEEAREVLRPMGSDPAPKRRIKELRALAPKINGTRAQSLLALADKIERALRTLHAAGEVR